MNFAENLEHAKNFAIETAMAATRKRPFFFAFIDLI